MPDRRRHRGAHPSDPKLFSGKALPRLVQAVGDLSWLLSRGYALPSALELVGNRLQLTARQRLAVMRSACSDAALARRARTHFDPEKVPPATLLVDGYNVLTTVEAALAGGVVLLGRDRCCRDLASLHGSWRKVEETVPALEEIGRVVEALGFSRCRWYLDRPVSNSGRLRSRILQVASARGWDWEVRLVQNPDALLARAAEPVATSDSAVLDRCRHWLNLAGLTVPLRVPGAWLIDLTGTRR